MLYDYVVPSSLVSSCNEGDEDFSNLMFNNKSLKMGVVLKRIPVGHKDNVNKLFPEYTVLALEHDKDKTSNTTKYYNVIAADKIGGVADFHRQTYREPKDAKDIEDKGSQGHHCADLVLLLCLDGQGDKVMIIGGMPNGVRKEVLSEDKGHHLEGEFNGIRYWIDQEGALNVVQKTKTDICGKPSSTTNAGSTIKLEKDGSFEINDAPLSNTLADGNKRKVKKEEAEAGEPTDDAAPTFEDGKARPHERLRIDRTAQKAFIDSRKGIDETTDGMFNMKSAMDMNMETKQNLNVKVAGNVSMLVEKNYTWQNKGNLTAQIKDVNMQIQENFKLQAQNMVAQMEKMQAKIQTLEATINTLNLNATSGALSLGSATIETTGTLAAGVTTITGACNVSGVVGCGGLSGPGLNAPAGGGAMELGGANSSLELGGTGGKPLVHPTTTATVTCGAPGSVVNVVFSWDQTSITKAN